MSRIDPMVRIVAGAMLLATLLPAAGRAQGIAQLVMNAGVFLLFLFYGMRLERREVLAGLGNWRMLLPLALWVYGAMAAAGWLLWRGGLHFLPETLALGFLYLGVLPSTIQSATAYTSLAGGNVAASVVAAALLNILGVFISAPLFSLLAGGGAGGIHADSLIKVMTMLLLPFAVGQALQTLTRRWVDANRKAISVLDRTTIAIAVYVAFSGAVAQGLWKELSLTAGAGLFAGCAMIIACGYGGAWLLSGWLKLAREDRISVLFAGGQKSLAMGAPLATVLFPPATAGMILLPLLVFHLGQMVVAAPIAARLKRWSGVRYI